METVSVFNQAHSIGTCGFVQKEESVYCDLQVSIYQRITHTSFLIEWPTFVTNELINIKA
jgi:hypothetical protein